MHFMSEIQNPWVSGYCGPDYRLAFPERKARGARLIDKTGQEFGRLTVMRMAPKRGRRVFWLCRCSCGQEREIVTDCLKPGGTESCGCFRVEVSRARMTTHGMRDSAEYSIWTNMRTRCGNPKNKAWADYGGRGIKICDRWLNSFENFLADMGPRPDGMTLERKDNNGDYSPDNCVWATPLEQAGNKRNNLRLTLGNETHHVREWERRLGVNYGTLQARVYAGWSDERVLTTPVIAKPQRKPRSE